MELAAEYVNEWRFLLKDVNKWRSLQKYVNKWRFLQLREQMEITTKGLEQKM